MSDGRRTALAHAPRAGATPPRAGAPRRATAPRWRAMVVAAALRVAAPALAAPPATQPAPAPGALHAIVVGASRPPARGLEPLRFADDDALRFGALLRAAGASVRVLTTLDAETRDAGVAPPAIDGPPTWPAVLRAADATGAAAARDRAAGRTVSFMLIFAGHGGVDDTGGFLALHAAAGGVERVRAASVLALLRRIPAHDAHLIIDACGAGDVFGVRGDGYRDDRVAPAQPRAELVGARGVPPHVGLVLSSAAGQRAYEWQEIEAGVFSHVVLSALTGAADADADGAVSYRELDAFVRAAVRRVPGRARPRARVVPPRAGTPALVRWGPASAAVTLLVDAAAPRRFTVEDHVGGRLLDVHLEPGYRAALHVPAPQGDATIYVHAAGREAALRARAGARVRLAELAFTAPRSRARGALAEALREGLFAEPFGPRFVADVYPGLLATALAPFDDGAPRRAPAWKRWWFWSAVVGVVAAGLGTGVYFGTRARAPGSELGIINR